MMMQEKCQKFQIVSFSAINIVQLYTKCRSKNTANILMKNFCDFMCGSVLFWILGFSIMFGTDHGFLGWDGLFSRSNGGNRRSGSTGLYLVY